MTTQPTIAVGDTLVETTPSGRTHAYEVYGLNEPPLNPAADPGPYVGAKRVDGRGSDLLMKALDIESVDWIEVRSA